MKQCARYTSCVHRRSAMSDGELFTPSDFAKAAVTLIFGYVEAIIMYRIQISVADPFISTVSALGRDLTALS